MIYLVLPPLTFLALLVFAPGLIFRPLLRLLGWYLQRNSIQRREIVFERVREDEKDDAQKGKSDKSGEETAEDDWEGVVGFFHPFCNAGGGGERVLWTAIRATQRKYPRALCVVYTGDHEVSKQEIIGRVADRFNIQLKASRVVFIYLTTRHYVLSSTYRHFTLLGQSLGSLILAYDAFSLIVPDIFIDTMGYAFTLALSKYLFPAVPTAAYVHYPTISTDMLGSLDEGGQGVNAGTGKGFKGRLKKRYWLWFANLYGWVGGKVDVVMANSTWTAAHIRELWKGRTVNGKESGVTVVFPPVAVEEMERAINVIGERPRNLLYIAQFRPEKNHTLILDAFAKFLSSRPKDSTGNPPRLVLLGSVRNPDDATRVYELRLLAHELKIKEDVTFVCDASWPDILGWLQNSWIGVNGMWNEHFGIGVVEYQAAGLISVVHDSGGPQQDIVVEYGGGPTGYHATTAEEFAAAFDKALSLAPKETLEMRQRARESAKRFTEEAFEEKWLSEMEKLVELTNKRRPKKA